MKKIMKSWNLMRVIRLVLGVIIIFQGIYTKDYAIALLGTIFTLMPIFNVGCCANNACFQSRNSKDQSNEKIVFEEVK